MYIYSADMLVIYTNVCILHPPKHKVYVDSPSLPPLSPPGNANEPPRCVWSRRRTDCRPCGTRLLDFFAALLARVLFIVRGIVCFFFAFGCLSVYSWPALPLFSLVAVLSLPSAGCPFFPSRFPSHLSAVDFQPQNHRGLFDLNL